MLPYEFVINGTKWEWAEDFESIIAAQARARGWLSRGYGVLIFPTEDKIKLYVTKERVARKKRLAILRGQLIF